MVASFKSNTREKKKWQPTQEYIHSKKKKKKESLLDMTHKSSELFMELILLQCSRKNRLRLCQK